jgi:Mlc titration factor MtfA (ptsG expression regulator)
MDLFMVIFLVFFILLLFCIGMSVLTSPILLLLYFDRDLGLNRLRYRISQRDAEMKRIIPTSTPFYNGLDEKLKMEYRWRVRYFIDSTDFIFKFKTDQYPIKLVIALKAVQLSLFLPARSFTMIHRIILYEDDYFSQVNQRYHKGEVNPGAGILVLSWSSVVQGLIESNDGLNVLVHELAHALWFEHLLKDHEYTIFNDDAFEQFEEMALREMETMNNSEFHFFRKYGATNRHEFFAVAVENFFERPDAFRTSLPALYDLLIKLLNHNYALPNVRHAVSATKNI